VSLESRGQFYQLARFRVQHRNLLLARVQITSYNRMLKIAPHPIRLGEVGHVLVAM